MRKITNHAATLVLLATTAAAIAACSSEADKNVAGESSGNREHTGSVSLKLQPVFGLTVNNVHYTVTSGNPAATPAPAIISEGNLPTPGSADSFSFGISLRVGSGYYVSLTGESAETGDNITCTGAYGPFAVSANNSTLFNMVLTCVDNSNGQVLTTVDADTDACPRLIIDYALAEPASADTGSSIKVHSNAHDLDNPAATLMYVWSVVNPVHAGVGQFTPANADDTTFTCHAFGDSVRIKVTASNSQCSKSLETVVSCYRSECGDGVVNDGETCETALDPTCPSDCSRVCGDGNAESGETCDPLPANPAVCIPPGQPGECTLRICECGDGFVCGGEACDTAVPLPPGMVCAQNCSAIVSDSLCGDGVVGTFEECDSGTGSNSAPVAAPSRTCTAQCESISTAECVACEQAGDCFASSDNCLGPSGAPFTAAQTTVCFDVMQCMQDSNCLDGTGSLGKCYCGTLGTAACAAAPYNLSQPGAPNGPCTAIMQQGNPGVTTNSGILGGLTSKSRPAGLAGQRLNCQKTDPACAPICGVQ